MIYFFITEVAMVDITWYFW